MNSFRQSQQELWSKPYTLFHPICLMAMIIMLLNDHYWKSAYGNWWTGKISDFAAAIVLPAWIEIFSIIFFRVSHKFAIVGACLLTVTSYVGLQCFPAFAKIYQYAHDKIFQILGWGGYSHITADVTDLWGLSCLLMYIAIAYKNLCPKASG